ncbi:unnamed protein product [Albugo candida]|uniref:Uncharacterized protein n=1 Tax=Albugo candida TaxID=65357 RepID=A0A024GLQ0_9STRA|nr:unnamed protein product [Albugo candida]|eukprot:CCI47810.1 unnamed protein product [Albugo candida]
MENSDWFYLNVRRLGLLSACSIIISLALHFVLLVRVRIHSGKSKSQTKTENTIDVLIVRYHFRCIQIFTATLQILQLYLMGILLPQSTLFGPTYYLSLSRPIFNIVISGVLNNVHKNTLYRVVSLLFCCQITVIGLLSDLSLSLITECVSSKGSTCSRALDTVLLDSVTLSHLRLHDTGSIFLSIWLTFEIALICILCPLFRFNANKPHTLIMRCQWRRKFSSTHPAPNVVETTIDVPLGQCTLS